MCVRWLYLSEIPLFRHHHQLHSNGRESALRAHRTCWLRRSPLATARAASHSLSSRSPPADPSQRPLGLHATLKMAPVCPCSCASKDAAVNGILQSLPMLRLCEGSAAEYSCCTHLFGIARHPAHPHNASRTVRLALGSTIPAALPSTPQPSHHSWSPTTECFRPSQRTSPSGCRDSRQRS